MRVGVLLAAAALAVSGCGGSSGGADGRAATATATPTPARDRAAQPTATTTPTPTADRDAVVAGLGGKGAFDPRSIYRRESAGVVTIVSLFDGSGLDAVLGGGGGNGSGVGSGFVLNDRGEVVTNAHVVTTENGASLKRADQVYVAFADGNRVKADVRGFDPDADVALLQIDPTGLNLNPLPLGSTEGLQVGSPVAAMGSPFGEEQSLSIGIVSAVDRDVESLTDFRIPGAIQTDAAINPGNSGGPLVDAQGRVIGLNQQIQTRSGGNEGVGFAVPIDLAKRSIDQLREKGRVAYAFFGVSTTEVYPQLARRFGLATPRGAWVQDVTAGGPAADAGLKGGGAQRESFQGSGFNPGGDVIISIGGRPVRNPSDLAAATALRDPGETVAVEIYRGARKRTLHVRLGRRPLQIASGSGR